MIAELPEDDIEEITEYRGNEFKNIYYYENQFYRKYENSFKIIPDTIDNRRPKHIRFRDVNGRECRTYHHDLN